MPSPVTMHKYGEHTFGENLHTYKNKLLKQNLRKTLPNIISRGSESISVQYIVIIFLNIYEVLISPEQVKILVINTA